MCSSCEGSVHVNVCLHVCPFTRVCVCIPICLCMCINSVVCSQMYACILLGYLAHIISNICVGCKHADISYACMRTYLTHTCEHSPRMYADMPYACINPARVAGLPIGRICHVLRHTCHVLRRICHVLRHTCINTCMHAYTHACSFVL